ncbi:MAG: site-2 protease family protein [Syntrophaceae bacterium]|nr:site-2 protease family protein [Syntrophaceae bacterium]
MPLMSILLVHEMGHFLAGRRRYLDVTPPYFIPAIPPVGTFGAFIKIRSPIPNRQALIEVGAAGPVCGAIIAIPLLFIGISLSDIHQGSQVGISGMSFGTSIVLELACLAWFGHFSYQAVIILHPVAIAAWFGLFVTAMNLLPMGQLDGGHVVYAMFGPRIARYVSYGVFGALVPLGYFTWPGWIMFAALALVIGLKHPPPIDTYTPPSPAGKALAWTAIALFVLTFVPAPISVF